MIQQTGHLNHKNYLCSLPRYVFQLRCNSQIKKGGSEDCDAVEASASKIELPLQSLWKLLVPQKFAGWKRHDVLYEKRSRKKRSSDITEKIKVIELGDLRPEVAAPKKATKLNDHSTRSRQRKE